MGARNAIAAYAMYPGLKHRAFRLLVGMALTALDEDNEATNMIARRYFGGENGMCELLGSARRAVYEALGELLAAGAVSTVVKGRSGARAVYQLHLDPLAREGAASVRETRTQECAGNTHPLRAGFASPSVRETRTPRRTEEPLEEITREEQIPSPSTSPAEDEARAKSHDVINRFGAMGIELLGRHLEEHPEMDTEDVIARVAHELEENS